MTGFLVNLEIIYFDVLALISCCFEILLALEIGGVLRDESIQAFYGLSRFKSIGFPIQLRGFFHSSQTVALDKTMNYCRTSSYPQLEKLLDDNQFQQVIEAIEAGKYSWACVLILRFAGYNPLLYIPYRTYNRLMKSQDQN